MQSQFRSVAALATGPVVVAVLSLAYAFAWNYMLPVHATLVGRDLKDVRVREAVYLDFDKAVDRTHLQLKVSPAEAVSQSWAGQRLAIRPKAEWKPGVKYTLSLGPVSNLVHSRTLTGWRSTFLTQPHVGVAAFVADGAPAANGGSVKLHSPITIRFTTRMNTSSLDVRLGDRPAPGKWSSNGEELAVDPPKLNPFSTLTLTVARKGSSERGDPVTEPAAISLTVRGLEPSNSTSGITPGFKTPAPVLVVIENSPPARPQSGFQQADIVYEYISEYSITRMTAIYFNHPPNTDIGPVRSCRTINLFLPFAYDGVNLCSGASSGTQHLLFTQPWTPALQDSYAPKYFFRVGGNAPHNLYTNGALAVGTRQQWPRPPAPYDIDPPHPDSNLGQPAPPPGVPLHGVSYSYDGGSRQYLRFDDGAPFVDASTGHQLVVKNIVMLHVGYRILGYVEDEFGGALSAWYDMLGSGPADIYSDGRLVHATWHMGQPNQRWSDNNQPVYFTDAQGNFIELNTGLTWIHVLGNGQTH